MAQGKKGRGKTVRPRQRTATVAMRGRAAKSPALVGGRRSASEMSLARQLKESSEREAATAEILKVIASSPSDVGPIFEAIAERSNNLIVGLSTAVLHLDKDILHLGAFTRRDKIADAALASLFPCRISDIRWYERTIRNARPVHIEDTELEFAGETALLDLSRKRGFRSALLVPLLLGSESIGLISVTRAETGKFSDDHVRLLQTFADQAVIAIQNARLFNETKEALERQTATAEILKVIASSPSDVLPVFEVIVGSAKRLLGGFSAAVVRVIDGIAHLEAITPTNPVADAITKNSFPRPVVDFQSFAMAQAGKVVQISDTEALSDDIRNIARARGYRSVLLTPMKAASGVIGMINVTRKEAGTFGPEHVELIKTFADQAVIAIENTRLFNETKEALERQTATSDVLKVISRSTVDLETVLDTLCETVARLCRADQAPLYRRQDDKHHLVAAWGMPEEARQFALAHPLTADRGSLTGRVILERRAIHIPDVLLDLEYTYSEGQKAIGYRTLLGIPLLREDALIGIFAISRTRVEPFTDKEIELASSFADQAVIAIENARLFEELQERQAELRVTFDNMGDGVVMFDAGARLAAWNRNIQEMLDLPDAFLAGRPSYADYFRYLAERGEYSSDLEEQLSRSVEDMRREIHLERTRPDGRVIEVRRNVVPDGGFVMIYADITERKRAEEAIRLARDAAEKALRDLQTAQDRLVQTEKLASLGQLTAGIAHEIKNPLNFVNNFSALSIELTDELNDLLKEAALAEKLRSEVDELTSLLKDNLSKVVQHGKRADAIVKNMLLHSRERSGERRSADINALVGESLNLAYHGARAEKVGFSITLKHDFDPNAGSIDLYPQEVTRALLNLISNGFYAATRRKVELGDEAFEPVLSAATRNLGKAVEIRIRDNGSGIAPEVREKIFNPFFTTKPTGEGTGLGLSMTHDIVVKQHGGQIDVETEPGVFTEFIITLPRETGAVTG